MTASTSETNLAPSFDPGAAICGDFGIAIGRDGTWYYHGSPIGRKPLVKLFASVLRRDDDGTYWLVTPAERGRIMVEDAPFTAVEVTADGEGPRQILRFRTNLDDEVEVGPEHPIRIDHDPASGAPSPYVHVRRRLEARILRPVYYHLVELGREEAVGSERKFGVWSHGQFFPLGPVEACP
ncbi:MAG: DUF1285 domain-containing protein [Alphaproteobacteria bacterium]|nr:DUF1285 domain-containing protein [Alphaproteobacteria bacterium]